MTGLRRLNTRLKRFLMVVILIFLSNTQPVKPFFVLFLEGFKSYQYATPSGGFEDFEMPLKHRTYESVVRRFDAYKHEHPSDTVLYRLFRKDPFLFWRWSDMISSPKYQLPYLNPDSIKEKGNE
ncbi:hypothetical protein [Larkinella knui]|uniref:Uncharacterized protein n=1 Tax=Larkinella knui TaxID=2025310 RepID=A0A3P1CYG6_9BACT|nr:hypothetical protein [Larkinella knui]RRB18353.1 hypothetical protein EHT87_08815 [Larkinella knui]